MCRPSRSARASTVHQGRAVVRCQAGHHQAEGASAEEAEGRRAVGAPQRGFRRDGSGRPVLSAPHPQHSVAAAPAIPVQARQHWLPVLRKGRGTYRVEHCVQRRPSPPAVALPMVGTSSTATASTPSWPALHPLPDLGNPDRNRALHHELEHRAGRDLMRLLEAAPYRRHQVATSARPW